jgi:hypothetical protein
MEEERMRRCYGTIILLTTMLLITTACAPSLTTPLAEVGARTLEDSGESAS